MTLLREADSHDSAGTTYDATKGDGTFCGRGLFLKAAPEITGLGRLVAEIIAL